MQSNGRRRAGKKLKEVMQDLNISARQISRATGVDAVTLGNLDRFTPHLSTIERVSVYLEQIARERRKATAAPAALVTSPTKA